MSAGEWTPVGLWSAVVASGLYHGANPAMGWPLAVSAGLMERRSRAVLAALGYLAAGHLLAMLVAIVPFAVLAALFAWQREVQIGAGVLVIGFGAFQLLRRRHPRVLARIRPSRLISTICGPPAYALPLGWGVRRAMPPMRTEPASFGFLGSVTSY